MLSHDDAMPKLVRERSLNSNSHSLSHSARKSCPLAHSSTYAQHIRSAHRQTQYATHRNPTHAPSSHTLDCTHTHTHTRMLSVPFAAQFGPILPSACRTLQFGFWSRRALCTKHATKLTYDGRTTSRRATNPSPRECVCAFVLVWNFNRTHTRQSTVCVVDISTFFVNTVACFIDSVEFACAPAEHRSCS